MVGRILIDERPAWRMRCFPLIGMAPPVCRGMHHCVGYDPARAGKSQPVAAGSTLEAAPSREQYFRQKLKRVDKARTNKNDGGRRVLFADA